MVAGFAEAGVSDGVRTHDHRNHNPAIYLTELHSPLMLVPGLTRHPVKLPGAGGDTLFGTPERTRTSNPRLRRPMLYPVELRAQVLGFAGANRKSVPA